MNDDPLANYVCEVEGCGCLAVDFSRDLIEVPNPLGESLWRCWRVSEEMYSRCAEHPRQHLRYLLDGTVEEIQQDAPPEPNR